jgi:hypothetical protein
MVHCMARIAWFTAWQERFGTLEVVARKKAYAWQRGKA